MGLKGQPDHLAIIDEYFINGFNATKAVRSVYPDLNYNAAHIRAKLVLNSSSNKAYIRDKQADLGKSANISPVEIARELKLIAFADLTDFLDLSEQEIKALPPDQRRALNKVNIKEKETVYKDGTRTKEISRAYSLQDRLKALDMLAKYIGFYEEDNRQKANKVNILALIKEQSPEALNAIEKAMRTIEV